MPYEEQLSRSRVSREEMAKPVARLPSLKGFDGGLPDGRMSGRRPER